MEKAMLIKNNSKTRPYIVQGITLLPDQDTEIPANLAEAAQRDIDGIEDLEVGKARAKPGPKPKIEAEPEQEPAEPTEPAEPVEPAEAKPAKGADKK